MSTAIAVRVHAALAPKGPLDKLGWRGDRGAFRQLDVDGDGALSAGELGAAIERFPADARADLIAALEDEERVPGFLGPWPLGIAAGVLAAVAVVPAALSFLLVDGSGSFGPWPLWAAAIAAIGGWAMSASATGRRRRRIAALLGAHAPGEVDCTGLATAVVATLDGTVGPLMMNGDGRLDAGEWGAEGMPATPTALKERLEAMAPADRAAVMAAVDRAQAGGTEAGVMGGVMVGFLVAAGVIAFNAIPIYTGYRRKVAGVYQSYPPSPATALQAVELAGGLLVVAVLIGGLALFWLKRHRATLAGSLRGRL